MLISCPYCKKEMEVLQSGKTSCHFCTKTFEAFLFKPIEKNPVPPADTALSLEGHNDLRCYIHNQNKAEYICERCGGFICPVCLTEIEGKKICSKCFDRMEKEGEFRTTKTSYFNWGSLILGLSLLNFFFYCISFITSPMIIGVGFFAYYQIKKDPTKRGTIPLFTGMGISLLVFIMWIVIFFNMLLHHLSSIGSPE